MKTASSFIKFKKTFLMFFLVGILFSQVLTAKNVLKGPIIGADISWVQEHEDKGLTYSDKGIKKDVFTILTDNKFNWIRLRLFVEPTNDKGYSKKGYCDLEHTITIAKRIKASGMKFLLDFHYSDNWADPGKQYMPASWSTLNGSELEDKIYTYTKEVIERFKKEGLMPDMVQIGNEINHGMVWPYGKIDSSYIQFSSLLRRAGEGVRAVNKKIVIMVHIACGGQNDESVKFFDEIIKNKVSFDVIGQSYYPEWHGTLVDLKNNLTDLALKYKKPIILVEYHQMKKEVNEIVHNLPNKLGKGTFIWEATSPKWGGLFDNEGKTTKEMELYPEIYKYLKK